MTGISVRLASIVFLASLAVLFCSIFGFEAFQQNRIAFFSAALRSAHVQLSVTLHGKNYAVNNGSVSSAQGERVSDAQTWSALREAYAVTLAERAPLAALPGTTPEALSSALQELEATLPPLSDLQKTRDEQADVLHNLYPFDFLKALGASEAARTAFIAQPTLVTETRYRAAQRAALQAFQRNLTAYSGAFDRYVPEDWQVNFLGGAVGRVNIDRAMRQASDGAREVMQLLETRDWCLTGFVSACDTADISLPYILHADVTATSSRSNPALKEALASIYGAAQIATQPAFVVHDTACITDDPAPLYTVVPESDATERRIPVSVLYLNDLYAYTVSSFGRGRALPIKTFLIAHGLRDDSYVPYTPTVFYLCPALRKLQGTVFALQATLVKIDADPQLAEATKPYFDRHAATIDENDIIRFLNSTAHSAANVQSPLHSQLNTLTDLLLMLRMRSAGLDKMVRDVASINSTAETVAGNNDAGLYTAEYLFGAKSGFPTLFELQNPSVTGDSPIRLTEPALPGTLKLLRQYSKAESSDERETFIRAVREWTDLHETLRGSVPVQ